MKSGDAGILPFYYSLKTAIRGRVDYILSRNVFELINVHVASPPFLSTKYDEHLTHAIKIRN